MAMSMTNQGGHSGLVARLVQPLAKGFSQTRNNIRAQHASWQRYHQTVAGRHIPRRAWMRHGAMLEQMGKRGA